MSMPLRRRLLLWLAPFAAAAAFQLGVEWLHAGRAGFPDIPKLAQASFEPLAPEAGSPEDVTLPHDWMLAHPDATRGRYRLEVNLPAEHSSNTDLYLPSAPTGTRAWVNGELVSEGDPFVTLATRYWHVPLYVAVPPALWREGSNEIALEAAPDRAGGGWVAPLYVGPRETLRPAYELRRFLQVTGVQMLVVAMVAFALFMALLWLLRRKEEAALWFALTQLVVAFGFWNLVAIESFVPKPSWNWVGVVIGSWLTATLTLFTHRLLGLHRPRLELALGAVVLAATAFFAASEGSPSYHAARPVWGVAVLLFGLYPGWLTLRRALFTPSLEASLLLASGLILNVAGAHDIGIANGRIPLTHDFAIPWAAVFGTLLSAWIFVRRFIVALDTSEALTARLEERVAEKSAELEANHARLRALERERAVTHERERIMAELHDGLGGQLVSTLAVVRSGAARPDEVEASLRGALDDMRLMIQSLELEDGDLGGVLASLRARLAPMLERAGVRVDWPVVDLPPCTGIGPEKALQVMRIAQEVIANVLKHAHASSLRVRADVLRDASGTERLALRLSDDGRGFASERDSAGSGRGLANMRRRAAAIGASLSLSSGQHGTDVCLELPLGPAPS
jgi:signal transduction histidine kinase